MSQWHLWRKQNLCFSGILLLLGRGGWVWGRGGAESPKLKCPHWLVGYKSDTSRFLETKTIRTKARFSLRKDLPLASAHQDHLRMWAQDDQIFRIVKETGIVDLMWHFLRFRCWQLIQIYFRNTVQAKWNTSSMAGWACEPLVCKHSFYWGTSKIIFWLCQEDKGYGGEVKLIFSVLLLVSIFTERFGEGSG